MRRLLAPFALLLFVSAASPSAFATHNADEHSANMALIGNFNDGATYRQGSDEAFWGNIAIAGNYGGPGGFRVINISKPAKPYEIGQFVCPGPQNDVSIWQNLVFVSVDSPRSSPQCGAGAASQDQQLASTAWEGIRIVSISNPSKPKQIATVYTDCGSHTHTLVPDLGFVDPATGKSKPRALLYVESYPLSGQGERCNLATHRKISVVEVPLKTPTAAKVISTPSVAPAIGCHDVTVLLDKKLAAAACISESQIWDISDPANPTILSHIYNPAINIHHSTTFSFDGNTAVIGDELGGAEFSPGCATSGEAPLGDLWFYDVSDPAAPTLVGHFGIPQEEISAFCTAHNFNTIPLSTGRDVLVSAWYQGGTTVVDFTDPSNPVQLGFYIPKEPLQANSWSSYWYNGNIYANNFDADTQSITEASRGFDVFRITDPALSGALSLGHLNPQTMEPLG